MPQEKREIDLGEVFNGTVRELLSIWPQVLGYLAVMLVLAVFSSAIPAFSGILGTCAYFIGQYWLYRTLLQQASLVEPGASFRVFRFFGMAVVLAVPISFGVAFFYIPGLILAARWIVSPAYLVAGRHGTFAAIGESWNSTSGNTLRLSLALFVIIMVWLVAAVIILGLTGAASIASRQVEEPVTIVVMHLFPLLMMGFSVTVYKALNREQVTLSAVFA